MGLTQEQIVEKYGERTFVHRDVTFHTNERPIEEFPNDPYANRWFVWVEPGQIHEDGFFQAYGRTIKTAEDAANRILSVLAPKRSGITKLHGRARRPS